jgi:hypothetical protein
MKKSSLKTFLAGKTPFINTYTKRVKHHHFGLKNTKNIMYVHNDKPMWGGFTLEPPGNYSESWYIDVLDDGTAITYCINE